MKHAILLAAAIAAPFTAAPTAAQTASAFMSNPRFQDPPPARCTSTMEMQHCAAHDLRIADAAMTQRYDAARAARSPASRQTLLAEQRRWLQARDRDCLAKGARGGSSASLAVAQCWIAVTRARTRTLAAQNPGNPAGPSSLSGNQFVGRWRGVEGMYLNVTRRAGGYLLDMQWDLDNRGRFPATAIPGGLRFTRNGVTETLRPGRGDDIGLSGLSGKRDCLIVRSGEEYCRY